MRSFLSKSALSSSRSRAAACCAMRFGYEEKGRTVVTRYNLAYINHTIHQGDNGRALGFDNAHDYHHRHYMGEVQAVDFVSYEATLERFQQEWVEIVQLIRRNLSRGKKS